MDEPDWVRKHNVGSEQAKRHRVSQVNTGATTPVVNEEIVLEMRYLYWRKGWSQKAVAEHFGIAPTTVSSILRNRTWKHVYLPEDYEP